MFEAAEVGQKVKKSDYLQQVPELRYALLQAQQKVRQSDFSVIIVISGDDKIGTRETVNLLHEWMDPRGLEAKNFGPPTAEELERPRDWRYWLSLPEAGKVGIFSTAWTMQHVINYRDKKIKEAEFDRGLGRIRMFERMMTDGQTLLLKFWLHLPKKELSKRIKKAEKNPKKHWQVTKTDRRLYKEFDYANSIYEKAIRQTSSGTAPWHVIESTDAHYRDLSIGKFILNGLNNRLADQAVAVADTATPTSDSPIIAEPITKESHTILDTVDLSQSLDKDSYEKQLQHWQSRLSKLSRQAAEAGLTTILAFEGWDAAGKGGVIRRMTAAMNAENYRVVSIAAPTDEEKAHHYLWRFWRHLPRAGHTMIFDRTWYGRVLVERVEKFATTQDWQRAYSEINFFEQLLQDHGVLLKFWLHIDPEEQLRRFKAREKIPWKQYKITEEDYRNREKWNEYELAVNEMIARTSTEYAPWHIVAANNKRFARIEVIKQVCKSIKKRLP